MEFLAALVMVFLFFAFQAWEKHEEKIQSKIDLDNHLKRTKSINQKIEQKFDQLVMDTITPHIEKLCEKRHYLVIKDEYNVENFEALEKEVRYFVSKVFLPVHKEWVDSLSAAWQYKLPSGAIDHSKEWVNETISHFLNIVENTYQKYRNDFENKYTEVRKFPNDPYEYEKFIGKILQNDSWRVRVTQGSNDQGADVIAEKNGMKLVVQCKRFKGTVGNKAVQEVLAGQKYFNATHAIVVASSGIFTKSAQKLAARSNVELLHHNQLVGWNPQIF